MLDFFNPIASLFFSFFQPNCPGLFFFLPTFLLVGSLKQSQVGVASSRPAAKVPLHLFFGTVPAIRFHRASIWIARLRWSLSSDFYASSSSAVALELAMRFSIFRVSRLHFALAIAVVVVLFVSSCHSSCSFDFQIVDYTLLASVCRFDQGCGWIRRSRADIRTTHVHLRPAARARAEGDKNGVFPGLTLDVQLWSEPFFRARILTTLALSILH